MIKIVNKKLKVQVKLFYCGGSLIQVVKQEEKLVVNLGEFHKTLIRLKRRFHKNSFFQLRIYHNNIRVIIL